MSDLRTAAQQALEALKVAVDHYHTYHGHPGTKFQQAIDDLSAALARIEWVEPLAQQAEPGEPVAWKQGNLVTFNEDPYPALGGLFVQFWDGEEVAARVYANDLETIRQRCAKVNTAPPQRKPLTDEEKRDLVTNWFAEDWAIEKALGLLRDYDITRGRR